MPMVNDVFGERGGSQLSSGLAAQGSAWSTSNMSTSLPHSLPIPGQHLVSGVTQRTLSMQELEAELLMSAQRLSPHMMAGLPGSTNLMGVGIPQGGIPPIPQPGQAISPMSRGALSVAELEAAMQRHSIQPTSNVSSQPAATPDAQISEQRRLAVEEKLNAMVNNDTTE
jgi:hypothetical protein